MMKKKPIKNSNKPIKDEKGKYLQGNPGGPGRPVGTLSITSLIKAELEKVPELQNKEGKNLNPEKRKWVEMFIQRLLQQSIAQGDRATQKLIWNYIDGLPKGSLDVTTLGEKVNTFDEKQISTIARRILNGDTTSEEASD